MHVNTIRFNTFRSNVLFAAQTQTIKQQRHAAALAEVSERIKASIRSGNGVEPADHARWYALTRPARPQR